MSGNLCIFPQLPEQFRGHSRRSVSSRGTLPVGLRTRHLSPFPPVGTCSSRPLTLVDLCSFCVCRFPAGAPLPPRFVAPDSAGFRDVALSSAVSSATREDHASILVVVGRGLMNAARDGYADSRGFISRSFRTRRNAPECARMSSPRSAFTIAVSRRSLSLTGVRGDGLVESCHNPLLWRERERDREREAYCPVLRFLRLSTGQQETAKG